MGRMLAGLLAGFIGSVCFAADHTQAIQAEIDQTVWRAFHAAFEGMDGEALNAVYADNVLRVTPAGLDADGAFKQTNLTRFDAGKARGEQIDLDFWFDSRQTAADVSYEVGFYRVGSIAPSGETSYFHGQFHIVLRKIDGIWKIVQDWDTASIGGRPISAADFARKPPAEFSARPE